MTFVFVPFFPFSKRAFSDVLESMNSEICSLASLASLGLSLFLGNAMKLYLTQCIILHAF